MASIRIQQFAGILPELNSRLKPKAYAQIAHNCLLSDGSLRPQAQWVRLQEYPTQYTPDFRGIAYDPKSDATTMYASFDPVTLGGSPFAEETTVGASPNSLVNRYRTGAGLDPRIVGVLAGGVSVTVSYQRSYDSNKPVNRVYAVSRVRKIGERAEEGPLIPVPSNDPSAILYEGDLVTINITAAALEDEATHIRIYRTVSGLDTGESVGNELDTKWYLVSELPFTGGQEVTYIDGASATNIPFDMNFSARFHAPVLVARYFGLTESGWFVSASLGGDIQVSERYMHHAWPVENELHIHNVQINDMAVHRDNVFFGTNGVPYIMAVGAGEKPMQAAIQPFDEAAACLPGSMVSAASGVIYASGMGLVSLSREGQRVLTEGVVNPGDTLYTKKVSNGIAVAKIANTSHGAYLNGKYYGFCEGVPIDDGVYYTTTLYPIENIEALETAAAYSDSQIFNKIIEALETTASFVSGQLRPVLQNYTLQPEAIETTATFSSGTLTSILVSIGAFGEGGNSLGQPDELTYAGGVLNVDIDDILITTNYPPDEITYSGSVLTVELT